MWVTGGSVRVELSGCQGSVKNVHVIRGLCRKCERHLGRVKAVSEV